MEFGTIIQSFHPVGLKQFSSDLVWLLPCSTREIKAQFLAQIFQILKEEIAGDDGTNRNS